MKKIVFALLVGLVLSFGCKTQKTIVKEEPEIVVSEKKGAVLQHLTQSYVRGMSASDSTIFFQKTLFYNSTEINLKTLIIGESKLVVDEEGVAHKSDQNFDLLKTVPKMTAGKIIDYRFYDNTNIIRGLKMAYDQEDRSYNLNFFRTKNEGFFVMSTKAEMVYEGKTYKVLAKFEDDNCFLLFYGDESSQFNDIKETAKGFRGGGSQNAKTNKTSLSPNNGKGKQQKEEDDKW